MITSDTEDTFQHGYGDLDGEVSLSPKDQSERPEDAGDIDRTDLLKLYLRDASRSSMLTSEGEVAGAKRIERARTHLNRLLSRSLLVAEYCIHLRQAFVSGLESPAELIEGVADSNPSNLTVSELADPALVRVESAYHDLRVAVRRNSRRRKPVRSNARMRSRLSRSIRSITFTPAAERRLVSLIARAAELVGHKPGAKHQTQAATQEGRFDRETSVRQIIESRLILPSEVIDLARKANAAIAELNAP